MSFPKCEKHIPKGPIQIERDLFKNFMGQKKEGFFFLHPYVFFFLHPAIF